MMRKQTVKSALSWILLAACGAAGAQALPPQACAHDRARLLALDENQFDQDMKGGWRALSAVPGCTLAAADLLHAYSEAHGNKSGLLFWHEAQLRAEAGQYAEAASLMQKAFKPAGEDKAGWNPYVEATVAFLRRDRTAFAQARARLAAVPPPTGAGIPPVVDGYMDLEFDDGSRRKMRWPLNIDVVEGLENCFDKPYREAYANACRQK